MKECKETQAYIVYRLRHVDDAPNPIGIHVDPVNYVRLRPFIILSLYGETLNFNGMYVYMYKPSNEQDWN